jgi:hypothetical protein
MSAIKTASAKKCYPKFKSELKTVYNLDISFDEYQALNTKPFEVYYSITNQRKLGVIDIQGLKVLAIRLKDKKLLVNVLSQNEAKPVPRDLAFIGISKKKFNADYEDLIKKAVALIPRLKSLNMDKKEFFVTRDTSVPSYVYAAAYELAYDRELAWFKVIRYLKQVYAIELNIEVNEPTDTLPRPIGIVRIWRRIRAALRENTTWRRKHSQ